MKIFRILIACLLPLVSCLSLSQENELRSLAAQIAATELEIQLLEDEKAIEGLQRIFGFYIDKHQWTQAADLFADNGTVEQGGEGVYEGKARILEYFMRMGAEGPQEGILNDHMQLQPVIHVLPDGTAKGRWHHFSQQAQLRVSHFWGTGIYENEYIKEGGVWKINKLHLYSTMRTPVDDGWQVTALPRSQASTDFPPDSAPTVDYENYPAVYVVPFHYENPVSAPWNPPLSEEAGSAATVAELTADLDALDHRLSRVEDADHIERLQTIYGYYLARNQWDELTGIFADDGTIEIAQRGVYRGAASIRRNLNLYGVQDELPGELHNHMQYQPVIHVDDDGQTARLRSRAFSMMGSFGNQGRFMGGTYENIFVKRDGQWMMFKDQQINTYFAGTDDGWINLTRSAPPGITASNPPDEPPSMVFEMYPKAFLPPYHYDNPVTGRVEVVE